MNQVLDELRAALYSIRERRWLALGAAWAACMLGWLIVAFIPNSYTSKARIYVQLDDVLSQVTGIDSTSKRDVGRIRQTLASAVNLEKVIRGTAIGETVTTPREMEVAILDLAKNVTVESIQDDVFTITASYGDRHNSDAVNAKIAQAVVKKLIDIFREQNLGADRGEMEKSLQFMDQQLEERRKQLEDAENKRTAYEAQFPNLMGGTGAGMQRLETARNELRTLEVDLMAAQSALAGINGQLSGTPKAIAGQGPAGGAHAALAQAEAELNALRTKGLTEDHPDVIAVRNQVAMARKAAEREGTRSVGIPNPAYSSLLSIRAEREANVQQLGIRRTAAQQEVAKLTAQQFTDPESAANYKAIDRDYQVLKSQYDTLLNNREALKLRGSVANENNTVKFQVIDPPTSPLAPSAPNRPLLLVMVLFAGLGAGAGTAYIADQLRSAFNTTAKLEAAIGLPVLGAISRVMTEIDQTRRKKELRYLYSASAALLCVFLLLIAIELFQRHQVA